MKAGDVVRLKNPDIVGVKIEGTVISVNPVKQLAIVRWKLGVDHGILSQTERLDELVHSSAGEEDG